MTPMSETATTNGAPPPPAGAPGAFALAAPGALEALAEAAGLDPIEQGATPGTFTYPDAEAAWRALSSSGNARRAIATSGEARVRAAIDEVNHRFMRPDGSVRYENVFLWLAARKP